MARHSYLNDKRNTEIFNKFVEYRQSGRNKEQAFDMLANDFYLSARSIKDIVYSSIFHEKRLNLAFEKNPIFNRKFMKTH